MSGIANLVQFLDKQQGVLQDAVAKPFFLPSSLYLELLQIWSFHVDHGSQQLVFQAIPGHGEVDQSSLSLQLGLVVRIGQLGMKDEPEPGIVFTLFISNFNESGTKRLM